jgi:hypothetical protein
MAKRRRGGGQGAEPPIPLSPVDLLAGLAPGLELQADELSAFDDQDAALTGVAEVGKLIRSGDATVRRLVRTAGVAPRAQGGPPPAPDPDLEPERAGVPPRTRERPGE